uniref:hypothetical protein n=1 Tax=Empedobacter falsenii TaxID=343874 RepID=UPI003F4930E8
MANEIDAMENETKMTNEIKELSSVINYNTSEEVNNCEITIRDGNGKLLAYTIVYATSELNCNYQADKYLEQYIADHS